MVKRAAKRKRFLTMIIVLLLITTGLSSVVLATDTKSDDSPDSSVPQCGHWVVLRSCELLGVPVEMGVIMEMLPVQKGGHSMLELKNLFQKIGLKAVGKRQNYKALTKGLFPVIANLNGNHFVTVSMADDKLVHIFDGSGRAITMKVSEFMDMWDGITLGIQRADRNIPLPSFAKRRREGSPCIEFDKLIIDKGEVPWNGKPIVYEFSVRNIGKSPLLIQNIKTSCGCLGAEFPKIPIPPGEKAMIILKYNLQEGQGSFKHEAFVKSNDPNLSLIKLTAAGNTDTNVEVVPKVAYLGKVIPGHRSKILIFVRFNGDLPLEIRGASCQNKQVTVTYRRFTQELAQLIWPGIEPCKECHLNPSNTYAVQLAFRADHGDVGKKINDKLLIRTNIKGFEEISVPIFGEVVNPVHLYPSILSFINVAPEEEIKKSVRIRSLDGQSFRVVSVDPKDSRVKCIFPKVFTKNEVELSFTISGVAASEISGKDIEIEVEMAKTNDHINLKLPLYVQCKSSSN